MKMSLNETTTAYQLFQKKEAPILILLHGWLQDWQSWSPLIHTLSKKYQLVLPDLPGFGNSTLAEPWSPEKYATWLVEFILSLKIPTSRPIYICGHSFGGKIAAITAALHAKTIPIAGLVLIDASGLPDTLSPLQTLKQSIISAIPSTLKNVLPNTYKYSILNTAGMATDNLQSNTLQKEILKKTVQHSIAEYLPKINQPVLLIWGEHDTETPIHQGEQMHIAIPQAKLTCIENAGHFPFVDNPSAVLESITDFIQSQSNKEI